MAAANKHDLLVDDFCLRQFSPEYGGSRITMAPADFEAIVNEYHLANPTLADGYAPFCKHVFMPNFAGLTAGTAPITPENEHLLRSVYEARTEQELPVMVRAKKDGTKTFPFASTSIIWLIHFHVLARQTRFLNSLFPPSFPPSPPGPLLPQRPRPPQARRLPRHHPLQPGADHKRERRYG